MKSALILFTVIALTVSVHSQELPVLGTLYPGITDITDSALDRNTGLFVHVDGSNTIRVIDRLIPDESAVLNTITRPGSALTGLILSDTLAFIADDSDSIHVYSIANLPELQYLTGYSLWLGGERIMPPDWAENGRAYHVEYGQGGYDLVVFDLFSGDEPVHLGTLEVPSFYEIQVIDNHLFESSYSDNTLIVTDINDPSQPDIVCVMPINEVVYRLYRAGQYLVLALDGNPGRDYQFVDVNDPANPYLRDSYHLTEPSNLEDVDSDRMVLRVEPVGMDEFYRIVDFSDPDNLLHIADIPIDNELLLVQQNHVWVEGRYSWCRQLCYDISNPTEPVELPVWSGMSKIQKALLRDGFVFVLDEWDGLRIVDISDPVAPVETGYLNPTTYHIDLSVSDGAAYLSSQTGLYVINTSDPYTPSVADTFDLEWTGTATDGITFAVQTSLHPSYYDVYLYDITNPTEPELASIINVPPNGNTIAWGNLNGFDSGMLLYSTTYVTEYPPYNDYTNIRATEVSDPWNPQTISLGSVNWEDSEYPYGTVHDSLLFVFDGLEPGDEDDVIRIYQLSIEADPALLCEYNRPEGLLGGPMFADGRMFLRHSDPDEFQVIDISNPANPHLIYEGEGMLPLYADYPYIIGEHDGQLLILDGSTVLGVEDEPGSNGLTSIPAEFVMHPVSPNPCNNQARLTFDLPAPARLTVSVYDILGREVSRISQRYASAGTHSLAWDASALASGIYFVHASANTWTATQKVILLK